MMSSEAKEPSDSEQSPEKTFGGAPVPSSSSSTSSMLAVHAPWAFPPDLTTPTATSASSSTPTATPLGEAQKTTTGTLQPATFSLALMQNQTFMQCCKSGRTLLKLLFDDAATAGEMLTHWFGVDETGWQWQRQSIGEASKKWFLSEKDDRNGKWLEPLVPVLQSLRVGNRSSPLPWMQERNINTDVFDAGANVRIEMIQDNAWEIFIPPSNATQDAFYNTLDGVIVVLKTSIPPIEYPAVNDLMRCGGLSPFSEAMWRAWNTLHASQGSKTYETRQGETRSVPGAWMVTKQKWNLRPWLVEEDIKAMHGFINYIGLVGLADATEVDLILRCLQPRGCAVVPSWENGQTFQAGHWVFNALLALPSCQDFVLMLIQRKRSSEAGHKVLKSVTIFQPCGPEGTGSGLDVTKGPALLWAVEDYQAGVQEAALAVEATYFDASTGTYSQFVDIPCGQLGS